MQFASYAFPLPQMVDSIDTAMQAVQASLGSVGAALGMIHAHRPQTGDGAYHNNSSFSLETSPEYKRLLKLGIPEEVLRQLKDAGFNPESLSTGELNDAAISFAADGRVIDDPEDTTLQGKMKRTDAEVENREEKKSFEPIDPLAHESFTGMIRRKRGMNAEPKPLIDPSLSEPKESLSFRAIIEESRERSHGAAPTEPPH